MEYNIILPAVGARKVASRMVLLLFIGDRVIGIDPGGSSFHDHIERLIHGILSSDC